MVIMKRILPGFTEDVQYRHTSTCYKFIISHVKHVHSGDMHIAYSSYCTVKYIVIVQYLVTLVCTICPEQYGVLLQYIVFLQVSGQCTPMATTFLSVKILTNRDFIL